MGFLDDATRPTRDRLAKPQRVALARYLVHGGPFRLRVVPLIADGFIELLPPDGVPALTDKAVKVAAREIRAERLAARAKISS